MKRLNMKRNRKKLLVMALGFVLAAAVLTGCGNGGQSGQDVQQSGQDAQQSTPQESGQDAQQSMPQESGQDAQQSMPQESGQDSAAEEEKEGAGEAQAGDETAESAGLYEDNFAVDSKEAKEFAEKVKEAVAQKDLEALAELTSFPVYVGLPNVGGVETKEEFLKLGAEAVFTDELLKSVEAADIENFQPSMAGFSISDGSTAGINFGVVDGVLAVRGINY